MLNYLWAGMMMLGIIYAAFTGRMPDITNAALDSLQFTASSGRHSVLERPFSETNGRPFFS